MSDDQQTQPQQRPALGRLRRATALGALCAALALAGCDKAPKLGFLAPKDKGASVEGATSTKLVERDIEAPEVFQVTEAGLWDGRPSLGGVWVAHPDATDPERVIIRNTANGKFVIGALFRRERDIPGPRLQVSSDAAAALSMLAGAPVQLNVTVLRRETVAPASLDTEPTEAAVAEPGAISETPLDPAVGGAAAAIAAAPAAQAPAQTPTKAEAEPEAKPRAKPDAKPESADKPAPAAKPAAAPKGGAFVQIGIFSVEANANRAAGIMRDAGMSATTYAQELNGKPFWRVVVGPANSAADRTALLKKVHETGFSDAYVVSN